MPEKHKPTQQEDLSRTGIMPRPVFEPDQRHEPERPKTIPEEPADAATTGILPIVSEGQDIQAERDNDKPTDS